VIQGGKLEEYPMDLARGIIRDSEVVQTDDDPSTLERGIRSDPLGRVDEAGVAHGARQKVAEKMSAMPPPAVLDRLPDFLAEGRGRPLPGIDQGQLESEGGIVLSQEAQLPDQIPRWELTEDRDSGVVV
jgi:hypothetical protein